MIEVVLVASILTLLARTLVETTASMSRVTSSGNALALLQEQGESALDAIIQDLRRSGTVRVNERDFPYVFDDGMADAPFDAHDHEVSYQEAEEGDSDYGVMRELVLVLPSDLDGNDIPDLDMDGNGWPELDGDGDGVATETAADYDGIDWDVTQHNNNQLNRLTDSNLRTIFYPR